MKVPKRPAGKPSRRATRSGRQQRGGEAQTKTSELLPSVDWVRSQAPKPNNWVRPQAPKPNKPQEPKPNKRPRRGRKK
jgi:hypothetical protein